MSAPNDPMPRVEPMVEIYVERKLGQTRQQLREEFTEVVSRLETQQREAALVSSREHRDVRNDLTRLDGKVTRLQASLETVLPLVPAVAALQTSDALDQAKAEAKDELLRKFDSSRRWTIGTAIALSGVVVGAVTVIQQVAQ